VKADRQFLPWSALRSATHARSIAGSSMVYNRLRRYGRGFTEAAIFTGSGSDAGRLTLTVRYVNHDSVILVLQTEFRGEACNLPLVTASQNRRRASPRCLAGDQAAGVAVGAVDQPTCRRLHLASDGRGRGWCSA
jgi:hypothetical protein